MFSKSGIGYKKSSQQFQISALDGLLQIKESLKNKTYRVSKYHEFKIYEPKERVIKASSFVDKIVQHSLCDNVLIPILEKVFIDSNFAGRTGKGTQYGLNMLKKHMELAYQKYGYDCWIIKADIRKFFYNIDHDILKEIVGYYIKNPDVYWLCEQFIDSTEGVGIPLGNRISQIFAILYLSTLDNFIIGELGVEFYGRYSDDFYLIVEDRTYAQWVLECLYGFADTLKLELNEKTQIIPFKNGIKFCGFHTYATKDGKVIRKLPNEKKRKNKKSIKR